LDNNEMMFSIDYDKKDGRLAIQYVKTDNVPISETNDKDADSRWNSYVQSYQLSYSTEGANAAAAADIVYEKIDADEVHEDSVTEKSKLNVDIDKKDYKSNIKQGSTNVFSQNEAEKATDKTPVSEEPLLNEWVAANPVAKQSTE